MPDQAPLRLLIVDDHIGIRQLCAAIAGRLGLECVQLENAEAALSEMIDRPAELILAELGARSGSGLQLLAQVKRRWPLAEVVLMSSYASSESAVNAMRLGAYDFVVKPFRVEEFQLVLERMAEKAKLVRENRSLRHRLQGRASVSAATLTPCTDLEELERLTVQRVFEQVDGDKDEARRRLGISRATLYRKIKRYGLEHLTRRKKIDTQAVDAPLSCLSQD
jgi:two-component system, NtrC family, response regulator PilR